jgi:hypothetical protein
MATDDISRHLFRPEHHYTGVRMQQSRPLLDSDVNEGELLDDEGQRVVAVEVIGPHGSADDGFKIGPVDRDRYDFPIAAGSYWLGGLRHEIADLPGSLTAAGVPQTLRNQTDWLQADRDDATPALPEPTGPSPRQDLVYLVGWEQSVSAVEDPEILELALGGPDTSSRIRRMHRVYVRTGTAESMDCGEAFQALLGELTGDDHTFDTASYELRSGARLTVVPTVVNNGNLCKPTVQQGYTGHEIQSIRVQCIEADRFLWGLDNTAPLYRIAPVIGSDRVTVTFLTPPKDHAHHPTIGQVLEILPWGAELPNGEKVADHQIGPDVGGGVFARVVESYDPGTMKLVAAVDDPKKLVAMSRWLVLNSRMKPRYFYARVWNPGDNGGGDRAGLKFRPNIPVPLVGTGLELSFSTLAIPGDHWVLAVRPSTPTRVVPWDLLTGAAPHGPRRFYCPLATVLWGAEALYANVESCRRSFRPLTYQGGCCTVTVGDGDTSFGDYTSINAALDALPLDRPAKICVLPGIYEERVIIADRSDLVIEGCGPRSIIRTPADSTTSKGLVTITACTNVTLRDLRIDAFGQFGVMIFQEIVGPLIVSRDITLENLDIDTSPAPELDSPPIAEMWIPAGPSAFSLPTIAAFLVDGLNILACDLDMAGGISTAANVVLHFAGRVVMRECDLQSAQYCWGGLAIGTQCQDVLVEHNRIQSGAGHGITLGRVSTVSESEADHIHVFDPPGRFMLVPDGSDDPRIIGGIPDEAPPPGGGDPVQVVINDGVIDVQIRENKLMYMGGSGISVLGFRPEPAVPTDPYEMIQTHDLQIADNRIEYNHARPDLTSLAEEFLGIVAFGGIVLADADRLRIHDNVIRNNGAYATQPTCGIYLLHGENAVIEDNQVIGNGPRVGTEVLPGIRAGIALQLVGRVVTPVDRSFTVEADQLLPAARVRGNVVNHPVGRALQIYGLGPMIVSGNVLVSQGYGVELPVDNTVAHCIEIQNIGQSTDLIEETIIPADIAIMPAPPLLYDPGEVDDYLIDGRILFTRNQVRFTPTTEDDTTAIWCATRLQSYGDVAVFDNQFLVQFPEEGGDMRYDTIVTAWSTRTTSNRWEDPAGPFGVGFQTDTSALTVAAMNITTMNQATRCIEVEVAMGAPVILHNPVDLNQTYTTCEGETELTLLFTPPPPPLP